jgi:hypothetical protein
MKSALSAFSAMAVMTAVAVGVAQEPPKFPPPTEEHQWLGQFVGEWESESKAGPVVCQGTMTSRKLGEYWIISDFKTEMAGNQVHGIQTIGYDPQRKKYVGTWVDNMMNHLWKYEGEVDSTGKILTLEAEGPNFLAEGKTALFRDAYEFNSPDHILATSSMQGEDGKWVTFMTGDLRRKK